MSCGKSSHRPTPGNHAHAHFPLRDDRLLTTLAKLMSQGKRDLAAVASGAATDESDRDDWHTGQTHEKVPPRAANLV